nr:terminase small subunit [Enterobacter hormaechei]
MDDDGLTAQQRLFVAEYLKDGNATQAAIRAGYSKKSAEQIGYQLLQKTSVAQAIAQQQKASIARTLGGADEVLAQMWQLATFDANQLTANTGITSIVVNRGSRPTRIHQAYILRRTWFSYYSGSSWSYQEAYTTGNTTKSSDGTLKAASPVARIVASADTCLRSDIAEDGFTWCGCGAANAEAEGITISRLDVGVYVLTGSAGLASEGWQLLPPMDPGGMGELGVVEAEQTENGGLTIRLFKRKYLLGDDGEIVKTKGEPMDVPANSWIDVRLDMPTDSVFRREQYSLQSDGEDCGMFGQEPLLKLSPVRFCHYSLQ